MPDKITAKAPWVKNLGDIPAHLDYFQGSMYDMLKSVADKYPNNIAMDFMGRSTTYRQLLEHVERCAKALKTIGIRENDCVTIAMPNCPQAIAMFYAINMVGGIANMVHPLSSEKEIEFYLNESNSVTVITLDQFYHKIEAIRNNTNIVNVIIASIRDELSQPLKTGYMLTEGRKIRKIPDDAPVIRWQKFLNLSKSCFWRYKVERKPEDPAVILYSGGTTGTTQGIVLTNLNFNALSQQVIATNPMFRPGDRMLAAMPIFHGFGLGVCIHTMLTQGGRCVLVPRFTAKSYSKLITKYKCNFIAGVPTLYEALLRLPNMEKADLSSLKGVFSGGDSLTIELKKKFDKFLYDHKAVIQIREGYGTTVMREYLHHPEETAQTLRRHADGLTWVYTGDLGVMDADGFVYFRGRRKRMIITSGYNVYPAQLENILEAHEAVQRCCIIGVPDSYKMQKVKAFVMLKPGFPATEETKQSILAHCRKNIAKYAMPYDVEFRENLPTTLVGKVAYRVLEDEELKKIS